MHGANPLFAVLELAILNAGLFIFFGMSLFKPHARRDWRTLRPLRAFLTLLFTEYYAVPLAIYLLAGWLQPRLPGIDWLSRRIGEALAALGAPGLNLHMGPFHWAGVLLAGSGLALVLASWRRLYGAGIRGRFPEDGPYAVIRHPVHAGLFLIMTAVLFECPTLVNLVLFPVLVFFYLRSARHEEEEAEARFGEAWRRYRSRVPAFLPRLRRRGGAGFS